MNVLVLVFALGMGLIGVIAFYYRFVQGAKAQISQLKAGNQQLRGKAHELQAQARALKGNHDLLKQRLEYRRKREMEAQKALEEAMGRKDKQQAGSVMEPSDIVDELLKENLVTPEQVAKAEQYRANSKKGIELDDTLVLLGILSPDVLKRFKARYQ